jgi:hypothetical protein
VKRLAAVVVLALALTAQAKDGETGVLGLGDPLDVGVVAGPWSMQTFGTSTGHEVPPSTAATLIGARLHVGAYTHKTLLGNGGGVEATTSIGYAIAGKGFFWGQLDALANVGLLNVGIGRFVARLHVLVGFGFSLYSGTSLAGGGRLALGVTDWFSLEATYLVLPTVNLTFAHRAQASLVITPIHVALGAELNFGAADVDRTHFSVVGTLSYRPTFD